MKYRYSIALAMSCLVPTVAQSMDVDDPARADSAQVEEFIRCGDNTGLQEYLATKTIRVSDRDYWQGVAETRKDLAAIRLGLKTRGKIEGGGALVTGLATGYGTCKLLPTDEWQKNNPTKGMGGKYGASGTILAVGTVITGGLALAARDNYNAGSEAQVEYDKWVAIVDYLQGRRDAIPDTDEEFLETIEGLQDALAALG